MEKQYIGTKIIAAEEMTDGEFQRDVKQGTWDASQPERLGYKVRYEDGYLSWSPKETFERAYREITMAERQLMFPVE